MTLNILLIGAKSVLKPLESVPIELSKLKRRFKQSNIGLRPEYEPYLTRSNLGDLLRSVENRIGILHFAGHSESNLVVANDDIVYSHHIAGIIKTWSTRPSLVFINGCNSSGQVKSFHAAGVKNVIATHNLIDDKDATYFANELYAELLNKPDDTTLLQAFERAGITTFMDKPTEPRSIDLDEMENNNNWDWGLYSTSGNASSMCLNDILNHNDPKGLESNKANSFQTNTLLGENNSGAIRFYIGIFLIISAALFNIDFYEGKNNIFSPLLIALISVATILGFGQLDKLKPYMDSVLLWLKKSDARKVMFKIFVLGALGIVVFAITCNIYRANYEHQIGKLLNNTQDASNLSSYKESSRAKRLLYWYWGRPEILTLLQMRKSLLRDSSNDDLYRQKFKVLLHELLNVKNPSADTVMMRIKQFPNSIRWKRKLSAILSQPTSRLNEDKFLLFLIRTYGETYFSERGGVVFNDMLSMADHYSDRPLVLLYKKTIELRRLLNTLPSLKEKKHVKKLRDKAEELDNFLKEYHGKSWFVASDEYQQALDFLAQIEFNLCGLSLDKCDKQKLKGNLLAIYERFLEARSSGKLWDRVFLLDKDKYIFFWIIQDRYSSSSAEIYPDQMGIKDFLRGWDKCCLEVFTLIIDELSTQYRLANASHYLKEWDKNTASQFSMYGKDEAFNSGFLIEKGWRY